MHKLLALAVLALLATPVVVRAADVPRSDADCAALLERWATDPKAAPKRVIESCKQQLAAAPAAAPAPAPAAPMARLDPCSGPDADKSVLCWGPWAALAPAAAPPLVALSLPDPSLECDQISDVADQCVPVLQPLPPIELCQPGTPCGFATIVAGVTSTGDPADTEFGGFDLASDASSFSVAPESGGSIDSVTGMTTTITARNDGYDNLRASGRAGAEQSRLISRVVRDGDGNILLAADIWTHGTTASAQSGYFAWGVATSQGGLDALNAGNITLSFAGPMSVNNATTGAMTLNFGSNPNWTGTWTNPDYSFGAGGTITGVNLISQPGQFTSNVTGTGNFVQGALVGEQGGPRGVVHIIDVTLEGQGRIKDVGLLRELTSGPTVDAQAGP